MELARRPDRNPQHEGGWHVYFGDVRVGHIGRRSGVPTDLPQWGWSCGFYPGCGPGQTTNGSASSFEEAKAAFEQAWQKLLPTLTEGDFEAWRKDRDFSAWKQRMWDEKCRLPTQNPNGISRCFCGETITNADYSRHIHTSHKGIGT
ncbi:MULTISPECIES: hypothetical protein [unclassified Bradyrhizobium]|uniref:hypothetical protein n=1 Tax=unclassified Bradyrhizobium TaxID=2631580 RepID=UPI0029161BC1|nr:MULTISPECIES: hypothetical protein [unclassified Bradyrhizobium]